MPITIRQTAAERGNNIRQIAPTLIIGMGGTGKEVLLRTRRRFFERFGEVGFPIVSYLWIDTDMRNIDLEGEKYDYLMEQVAFKNEERIDASISGQNFAAYFKDPESYPHIFSWLDPGFAAFGQVIDGAGQKRPFGRFAFFHHHRRIREQLLSMKNDVLGSAAADKLSKLCQRHGLPEPKVDRSRLDVIFVFSVAGGTGSGMFLDAAFFTRDALVGNTVNQTGYLFLPSVYNPDIKTQAGQPIYANAYAALKELEHYSLAKDLLRRQDDVSPEVRTESDHHFKVEWARGEPKSLPGPPFNTCYLLDNQSVKAREALRPEHKKNLCDMVAEAIFLDFNEGNFAALKRSTRANLEQFLLAKVDMDYQEQGTGKVLFTDTFSCRFSSFGLSKVYVPADRIRRTNAFRLASEMLDGLLQGPPAPGDISAQVKRHHFGPMGLEENAFLRALTRHDDNTDTLIQDELRRLIEAEAAEWMDALPEAVSRSVKEVKSRLLREFSQDSDPAARPGDYLARVRDANPQLLARKLMGRFDPQNDDLWAIVNDDPNRAQHGVTPTGSIGRVVRGWLDDPRFRLPLACAYLDAATAIYRDELVPAWRKSAEERKERALDLDESISRRLTMLEDEEEKGKLLPSKKALLRRLRRDLQGWAAAQIEERAYITGVELATARLLPYLERLVRFLRQLEKDLQALSAQLKDRKAAFEKEKGHQIFEEIFDAQIVEHAYALRTADGHVKVTPELLLRFEKDALAALELRGVADLAYVIALRGAEGLGNQLEGLGFERFRDLSVRFDVLAEARRIYPDKIEDLLRSWARKGSFWLPPDDAVSRFPELDNTLMDILFLGAPEAPQRENEKLLALIENTLKEGRPPRSGIQRLVSTGTDAVYVYSEVAGIAMPYIRQIEHYLGEAYLSPQRKQTVHIDFFEERFPQEIVLQEFTRVREVLKAYELLLVGTLTGILTIRKTSTGRLVWSYMDHERRPPLQVELGPELFALNTLRTQPATTRQVEAKVARGLSALEPERKQHLYAISLANLEAGGSFPPRWRFGGGKAQEVVSHGRHILTDFALRLERLLEEEVGADRTFLAQAVKAIQVAEVSKTVAWQEPPLRVLKEGVPESHA